MKKIVCTIWVTLLNYSVLLAQLPDDFPFKTHINEFSNLFITGFDNYKDIETQKFSSDGNLIWKKKFIHPGFDRGMDLVTDFAENVYVTGFVSSDDLNSTHMIFLKHNYALGDIEYHRIFDNGMVSKGFGLVSDQVNFYSCGFISTNTNNDLIIVCHDADGDTLWTRTYDNPAYHKDDCGTDILTDGNFIYVIGNTYNGPYFGHDIFHYTCGVTGINPQVTIVRSKYTNDVPTSFIIAQIPDGPPVQKSRTAVTVLTDNPIYGSGTEMRTMFFKDNETTELLWSRSFSGSPGSVNVPASLDADHDGNVYVAGYSNTRNRSNYDFITTRYNSPDGSNGWNNPPVLYYDSLNGNDKASSVKVNGNKIMIAGTSDSTQNGYYIAVYGQIQASPIKEFDRVFIPSFSESGPITGAYRKHSTVELDSSGNIYLIAQMWNETEAYFAVRKFSPSGEILYTIDPFEGTFNRENRDGNKTATANTTVELLSNYPNPFNPNTIINYELSDKNFVTLKVYDIAGREVTTLVSEIKPAGKHTAEFDAAGLSSGVYYAVLNVNGVSSQIRMVLMK